MCFSQDNKNKDVIRAETRRTKMLQQSGSAWVQSPRQLASLGPSFMNQATARGVMPWANVMKYQVHPPYEDLVKASTAVKRVKSRRLSTQTPDASVGPPNEPNFTAEATIYSRERGTLPEFVPLAKSKSKPRRATRKWVPRSQSVDFLQESIVTKDETGDGDPNHERWQASDVLCVCLSAYV